LQPSFIHLVTVMSAKVFLLWVVTSIQGFAFLFISSTSIVVSAAMASEVISRQDPQLNIQSVSNDSTLLPGLDYGMLSGIDDAVNGYMLTSSADASRHQLSRLEIKRAPAYKQNTEFLYTVIKPSNSVGLLSYDGFSLLNIKVADIDLKRLVIIDCASSVTRSYTPSRPAYVSNPSLCNAGYERIARNNEAKWFPGKQLGINTYYSRTLDGEVQCLSYDGSHCLQLNSVPISSSYVIDDNQRLRALENNANKLKYYLDRYNSVSVVTSDGHWTGNIQLPQQSIEGRRLTLDVRSSWGVNLNYNNESVRVDSHGVYSVVFKNGRWVSLLQGINSDTKSLLSAKPVVCSKALNAPISQSISATWCRDALHANESLQKNNIQQMIDSKLNHMDRLFDQMRDWKLNKVDVDNNYAVRLKSLEKTVIEKGLTQDNMCSTWSIWTFWGMIACSTVTDQYNDLVIEYTALKDERAAKQDKVKALIASGRNTQWHQLHKSWAKDDRTYFGALLKEESLALADLKELGVDYDKTVNQKHAEYLAAVKQYMKDTSDSEILLKSLEDLPLIGLEVKHIADYAEDPSSKNLRRMLLGLAGPVGEAVEGGIELATGDSSMDSHTLKFLTDVLSDLDEDDDLGQALEDIVSDAINDLGDEALESVRQAGLWVDRPGQDNQLKIAFRDIVDLRSQSVRYEYDPWLDNSSAARLFQKKFTLYNRNRSMRESEAYQSGSMDDIESAAFSSVLNHRVAKVFAHSFGKDYIDVVKHNAEFSSLNEYEINQELYKVIADPAYYEQRIPHWVDSAVIGQRPAGLLYDNDHAVIVFNADFLDPRTDDLSKFYFEELGHLLNWWRCKVFSVDVSYCEVNGDEGARFRDAVLIDTNLHKGTFESLLTQLPAHAEIDQISVLFNGGKAGVLEGWPNYYTMNDHIASKGKFNWLMRLGLDIASEYPAVSDEFDLEVSISAPSPAKKGNPWALVKACKADATGSLSDVLNKSARDDNCYCEDDSQSECNMPTMWVTVSFRDAIKLSIAKLPKVKDSKAANAGFDLSPRIVRKHGGKLPFQLQSVAGTEWKYQSFYNIYYKKFIAGLEAKLDLWKMGHAIKKGKPSSVHKPELSFKSTPAEGSYLVEIATRDKQDFGAWLAADITSAVAGCAAGVAIGVVAEQDPVLWCHAASDVAEGIESAFQGLDKKPTMLFEADGNVTLPLSLEYKYATSGNKIRANVSPEQTNYNSGRVSYNRDSNSAVWSTQDTTRSATVNSNPQVSSLKTKTGAAFKKLGARSLSPVAVFRFRVSFDYSQQLLQAGTHNLPATITSD